MPRARPPPRSRSAGRASQAVQLPARVVRRVAQLLGDAQQLVVLRDAVGARRAPGLDLPYSGRHGEVGDEGILRLAGAVRDHGAVSVGTRVRDALQRLGERPDLVQLDQDRVRYPLFVPPIQTLEVAADKFV